MFSSIVPMFPVIIPIKGRGFLYHRSTLPCCCKRPGMQSTAAVVSKAIQMGRFPRIRDTSLGGPYNKDCNILGSILGSPCFWKLPNSLRPNCLLSPVPIFVSPRQFGVMLTLFWCSSQKFWGLVFLALKPRLLYLFGWKTLYEIRSPLRWLSRLRPLHVLI